MSLKRISSTDLARSVGDILSRVRYRGESFIIERNGKEVALLTPPPGAVRCSLKDVLTAWLDAGPPDPDWAASLEEIGREDKPLKDPWESSSTPAP